MLLEGDRLGTTVPYTDHPTSGAVAATYKDSDVGEIPHPDHFEDDIGDHDNAAQSLLSRNYNNRDSEEYVRPRPQSRGGLGYAVAAWNLCFRRRRSEPQDLTGKRRGFSAITRSIFNYPEPDKKFRSTGWLDGLRGLAAFQVYIYHYADQWLNIDNTMGPAPDNNPNAWWSVTMLRLWYACGPSAVCLFFSISGFALTTRMLAQIRRGETGALLNSLSSAVMRRGIRLYLPVIITTFLLMTAGWWFEFPKCTAWAPMDTYPGEIFRWYGMVTQTWMPLRYPDRLAELISGYDGAVSWTIPLEYYGSIITYLALLFTARIRKFSMRTAILGVFIYMYAVKDEWYVVQFLVGAIYAEYQLFDAERNERINANGGPYFLRWRIVGYKVFLVLLLIFGLHLYSMPNARVQTQPGESPAVVLARPGWEWIASIPLYMGWYEKRQIDRFIFGIAANIVFVVVGELAILRNLFLSRPMQYLGRISFGLYLSHKWVREFINLLTPFLFSLVGVDASVPFPEQPVTWRYALAYWIRIIISMPVNFIVAGVFERTVDTWSINLGKKFENFMKRIGNAEDESDRGKAIEMVTTTGPASNERQNVS